MLLLYTSLARGPVSIAAPLISSTPAFVVPGALLLGVVPSSGQLFAMAGVMVGTLIVARTAHPNSGMREGERGVGMTVATGLGAAFLFAVALLLAREAVPIYGVWQVAWSGRCISLVFVILFMILTRTRVNVPARWWPALVAQGVLDAGGLIFLYVGSVGDGAPLASIGSAPLAIVAVLLARIFLKERIPSIQLGRHRAGRCLGCVFGSGTLDEPIHLGARQCRDVGVGRFHRTAVGSGDRARQRGFRHVLLRQRLVDAVDCADQ